MINKFEMIGIAASVGLMALALFLLRVENTAVSSLAQNTEDQAAVVVVAEGGDESAALYKSLADAVNLDGEVEKLVIDDVTIGTGPAVESGDSVSVHYVGRLQNGQEFDNSYNRGEPFTFTVGAGRVISGWETGIVGMQAGGQRILVIPPQLGYGNQQIGPIPANSTLIFSIELLEIN